METINKILGTSFENCWFDWIILVWAPIAIACVVAALYYSFRALLLINKINRGAK